MSIYQGNKKVSGISLEPDMQNSFRSLTETSTVSSDDEVIIKHGSTVYKGTLADVVKSVTQNSITGDTGLPASDSAVNDALTEYRKKVNYNDGIIISDNYTFTQNGLVTVFTPAKDGYCSIYINNHDVCSVIGNTTFGQTMNFYVGSGETISLLCYGSISASECTIRFFPAI